MPNVIGRHDFLPYGEEVPASTAGRDSTFGPTVDTVTTKFTSQLRDAESGMDYFNARNFTAPLGRFMSPDPVNAGSVLTDPQTWNGYAYVRNSPMHMVDPSGMDGFGSDPGEGDPCLDDPSLCDPGPGWFPLPSPPPSPPPPPVTEGTGGNPLPPGSFPNGETLGLPRGVTMPSTLRILLGVTLPNPFIFSIWSASDQDCVPGYALFTPLDIIKWFPILRTLFAVNPSPKHPMLPFPPWASPTMRYCGLGTGTGAPVKQVDGTCQVHDICYDVHGITAATTVNPFRSAAASAGQKACDQQLCNSLTKINPDSRGESGSLFVVGAAFSCAP